MVQLAFANGAAGNLYSSCSTSLGGGVSLTVWGTDLRAEFTGWEHTVKIHLPGEEQVTIPGEAESFPSKIGRLSTRSRPARTWAFWPHTRMASRPRRSLVRPTNRWRPGR